MAKVFTAERQKKLPLRICWHSTAHHQRPCVPQCWLQQKIKITDGDLLFAVSTLLSPTELVSERTCVDNPALCLLDEWQERHGNVDETEEVDT